jgi:uncharacterized protein (TIGR03643 family)
MNQADIHRVIEMAWEDKTSFHAIKEQYNLSESNVMDIMKRELKRSSYIMWRKRVHTSISRKHPQKRSIGIEE